MLIENVEQLQSLSSLRVLRLASKGMGFRVWSERRLRLMPDILPPSIVELRVDSCFTIVPAVLSGAPKLTYLELSSCHFETQGGTGLKFDGAALLEVFSGLSELDTLILEYFSDVDWPTPSSVYGGLTASSRLRELHIRGMHKWPQSASKYVFPPGRVLPHVRCIDWCDAEWAWDAEGVARVVSACAGLQELQLHVVSNPHVANALQPLTTLTHLSLSGLGVRDCYFTNQASPGQPPDVCAQLQEWCGKQEKEQPPPAAAAAAAAAPTPTAAAPPQPDDAVPPLASEAHQPDTHGDSN